MTASEILLFLSQFIGPIAGVMIAHTLARKAAKSDTATTTITKTFSDMLKFNAAYVHAITPGLGDKKRDLIEPYMEIEVDKMMLEMLFGGNAATIKALLTKATTPLIEGQEPERFADKDKAMHLVSKFFVDVHTQIIVEMRRLHASLKTEEL